MPHDWSPPEGWVRLTSIDDHTAGEPLRIIPGGLPAIPGNTILEKRRYAKEHLDHLRTALMWEPRGHADMYGTILTEPVTPDGDVGVLFLHNEGYSTMCGHGIIGIGKVALDGGLIALEGDDGGDGEVEIRMDTPAGRVTAYSRRVGGVVQDVSFHNVPSFVASADQVVEVPGLGQVRYDLAFGGAYYAFCRAEDLDVGLTGDDFRRLIDVGMRVKLAVMEDHPIEHPFEEDLGFLYGTIIVGEAHEPAHHSRNVCIFADGEVDRCPTGTGVSARAAIHYARGEIGINEPFVVESILGTCFTGRVVEEVRFGPYDAVVPRVTGAAYTTGKNEWWIDPDDSLGQGFILR